MSQAMTLVPQLYQVKGQGESNDPQVELKMKGAGSEIDYAIEIGELFNSCHMNHVNELHVKLTW